MTKTIEKIQALLTKMYSGAQTYEQIMSRNGTLDIILIWSTVHIMLLRLFLILIT